MKIMIEQAAFGQILVHSTVDSVIEALLIVTHADEEGEALYNELKSVVRRISTSEVDQDIWILQWD